MITILPSKGRSMIHRVQQKHLKKKSAAHKRQISYPILNLENSQPCRKKVK